MDCHEPQLGIQTITSPVGSGDLRPMGLLCLSTLCQPLGEGKVTPSQPTHLDHSRTNAIETHRGGYASNTRLKEDQKAPNPSPSQGWTEPAEEAGSKASADLCYLLACEQSPPASPIKAAPGRQVPPALTTLLNSFPYVHFVFSPG